MITETTGSSQKQAAQMKDVWFLCHLRSALDKTVNMLCVSYSFYKGKNTNTECDEGLCLTCVNYTFFIVKFKPTRNRQIGKNGVMEE
jgi:hypothetical protein